MGSVQDPLDSFLLQQQPPTTKKRKLSPFGTSKVLYEELGARRGNEDEEDLDEPDEVGASPEFERQLRAFR